MDNLGSDGYLSYRLNLHIVNNRSYHYCFLQVFVRELVTFYHKSIQKFKPANICSWLIYLFRNGTGLPNILINGLFSKFIFIGFVLGLPICKASYAQHHSSNRVNKKSAKKTEQSAKSSTQIALSSVPPFGSTDSSELPVNVVAYAKTLIGTPYLYASIDPLKGFDCSGFITYVFGHFNLMVPRSSVDFTNYGREVTREESKPGDLVLFTGTDSTIKVVGHMGIVVENDHGDLQFIHSSSGTANGVVISRLTPYYLGRFVKITRVFKSLE